CASLGEFEQGRPLLAYLQSHYPHYNLIVTFFSPSGYEPRKNFKGADIITYLPLDTKKNAQDFIDLIKPSMAIFVKYEFWYHYLHVLYQKKIPTYLVAGIFQPRHPFFKWYGRLHRKMLSFFTSILVQESNSKKLLNTIGFDNVVIAGDPRFDSALSVAQQKWQYEQILQEFTNNKDVIIAGSTWDADVELLVNAYRNLSKTHKLII